VKVRRVIGVVLVVAGGLLMWLAPETAFAPLSTVGTALLFAGIALEAVGIALEHRK
jgi:hypothetical protein